VSKKWTGNLVGLMHDYQISQKKLAQKLGYTFQYVSMVLNGKREPPGAEARFTKAVYELIDSRGTEENQ
jgi:transcriptional regulator with XRE-family HTH domain